MRRLAIETLYHRSNTSKPALGDRIYPRLLRGLAIMQPNQVWAMEFTYIPMARSFVYLAAVVDWFSCRVLRWRLSITMDTSFCIEALEKALSQHDKPEILNTDQGSQFTCEASIGRVKNEGIAISMDDKGGWCDNVFVERFWRSLNYEHFYLHAHGLAGKAKNKIGCYLAFYIAQRPHSSPGVQTSDQVILPPSSRNAGGLTRDAAGCGNAGLIERAEVTRLFSALPTKP